MYINDSPILYLIDETIRYQITKQLEIIIAKHIWNILYLY